MSEICDRLYDWFSKPDCWVVYDDVRGFLSGLKERHITVGIVSNFDSRLGGILPIAIYHVISCCSTFRVNNTCSRIGRLF